MDFAAFSVKSTEKQIFKLFSVILTRVRKEVYRMEGKQDELFTGPTLQKIEDMMEYAYPVLQQFPKSEKFAMAADIKLVMDVMLEKAVEAQKNTSKRPRCRNWTLQTQNCSTTCVWHFDCGLFLCTSTRYGASSLSKSESCWGVGSIPSRPTRKHREPAVPLFLFCLQLEHPLHRPRLVQRQQPAVQRGR